MPDKQLSLFDIINKPATTKRRYQKHDWGDLRELYIEKQLSCNEIAEIKECSSGLVYNMLKASQIPRRTSGEGSRLSWQKGRKVPHYPKGGRFKDGDGYIMLKVHRGDFFYPMATKAGYVMEHRLVVAKQLNRCLLPWEVVHHKGTKYPSGSIENRADNRIENLELLPQQTSHLPSMGVQRYIKELQQRVTHLEAELTLLRAQLDGDSDHG